MSATKRTAQRSIGRQARIAAFTLVEVLVVIGIVALMLAIIAPILRGTIAAARGFNCQMSLRSACYDFAIFADDVLHGSRGSDSTSSTFSLASFQDSLYGTNEFWAWPQDPHTLPDLRGDNPMRCPEVRGALTMRANAPCDSGGVSPLQSISFTLNARLHWREVTSPSPAARRIRLTSSILSEASSSVPLLWDVAAAAAVQSDSTPFYGAPSLDSPAVFAGDQFWFPGLRHNAAMNVGFVDGHVDASRAPLGQTGWRWDFVPGR